MGLEKLKDKNRKDLNIIFFIRQFNMEIESPDNCKCHVMDMCTEKEKSEIVYPKME